VKRELLTVGKKEGFNWRKLKSMGSLGTLGFIMLFQYQNCAPATGARDLSTSSDNGLVTTIDDVNASTGLAFVQSKVQVASSDQPTLIDGACASNQSGAVLGWKVHDADGNMMESGYSVCDQGKFQVEMAPANQLECDQPYDVSARLGSGQSGHVELSRDCTSPPVAAN
jgi:hypothetical protein